MTLITLTNSLPKSRVALGLLKLACIMKDMLIFLLI